MSATITLTRSQQKFIDWLRSAANADTRNQRDGKWHVIIDHVTAYYLPGIYDVEVVFRLVKWPPACTKCDHSVGRVVQGFTITWPAADSGGEIEFSIQYGPVRRTRRGERWSLSLVQRRVDELLAAQ